MSTPEIIAPDSSAPEISVVIVAEDGGAPHSNVFDALSRQTMPRSQYEVLVVVDGSAHDITREIEARGGVRMFRQRTAGRVAAMNLGMFASKGRIVLFMPGGHSPSVDFLTRIASAHRQHRRQADVIYATLKRNSAYAASPLFALLSRAKAQAWREPDSAISFKRQFLIIYGIFDTRFEDGWERVELLWRLRNQHPRIFYERRADLTMGPAPDFLQLAARAERQGRNHVRLANKHSDEFVDRYAQIDSALALWAKRGVELDNLLLRIGMLQREAQLSSRRNLKLLRAAYLDVFALFRAKGVDLECALGAAAAVSQ